MTTKPQTITIELPVSDQFCRDVLCTAVEGGSNYWASFTVLDSHQGENGSEYQRVQASDEEADDGKTWIVGLDELREGMRRLVHQDYSNKASWATPSASYSAAMVAALRDDDAGQVDANLADIIFQLAAFGHIVYG